MPCSLEPQGLWPPSEGDPQKRQKTPVYSAEGGGGEEGSGGLLQEGLKDGKGWTDGEEVGVGCLLSWEGCLSIPVTTPQLLPRDYIYFKPGKSQPLDDAWHIICGNK